MKYKSKGPRKPPLVEVRFHQLARGERFKFYSGLDLTLVRSGRYEATYDNGTVDMLDAFDARVHKMGSSSSSAVLPSPSKSWLGWIDRLICPEVTKHE